MITRSSIVLRTALTLIAAIGVSGCGSSATTATATSPSSISRCAVTVNGDGQVPAAGATKSFTVSAARECAWAASVEATWLAIKAGASGQGDGTVEVAAAANPDPLVRRGSVVLNEQRVEVMQAAAECSFSLSAPSSAFSQTGGSGAFDVRTSSALCPWTASSDAPWIAVRSGASGKGNAAVEFDVSASTGTAARTGTITAAGLRFTVTQQPATTQPPPITCSYVAAPLVHTVATAGGAITVAVTTGPQCPWTAASSNSWIAVAGPSSFSGPGTATFNVAASSGPARSGTAVVAGQAVAISQGAAACSYTLSAPGQTMPEGGGSGTVVLTTGAACPWSASSTVPWLTITSPASGAGTATVGFSAAAQSGPARTGTLAIGGQTFTVMQGGVCTFAIAPEVFAADSAGAAPSIAVTAAPGCAWSSSSQAPWLTLRAQGPENGYRCRPGDGRREQGGRTLRHRDHRGPHADGQPGRGAMLLQARSQGEDASQIAQRDHEDRRRDGGRLPVVGDEQRAVDSHRLRVAGGGGDGVVWIQYLENNGAERVGTVTIGNLTFTLTQRRNDDDDDDDDDDD